jgi:DNA-binding CsgD family transcriptional regulator
LQSLLQACLGPLGADQAYFVTFVRDDEDLVICRFMLACEASWCRLYLHAGCQHHDPWLVYATHHSEPLVASALDIVAIEHRQVLGLIREGGFHSTLLVPAHSGRSHSRTSLLCLGSRTPGHFEQDQRPSHRILARGLAAEMHEWWSARIRRELVDTAQLTPTELSLVRHQCAGHGSKHIASELNVSPASIDSRFQRLHAKLGVPNRRLAARLLVDSGLILPTTDRRARRGRFEIPSMNTAIPAVSPIGSTSRS